ncbi:hypothetical protein PspTeo4_13968 [Pseudomonas sp. Teo4]|nr:hypothetical protein [Pseudomonas sp. Teo4]
MPQLPACQPGGGDCAGVHAGLVRETIEFDNGATIDWSVTTSYGVGVRLGKPSDRLLGVNADDANRNFNEGSLTTNRVGALGEMILRMENYGAVVRASTFYDDVYHRKNDNDSPATVNKDGDNDKFTSDARYYSGGHVPACWTPTCSAAGARQRLDA